MRQLTMRHVTLYPPMCVCLQDLQGTISMEVTIGGLCQSVRRLNVFSLALTAAYPNTTAQVCEGDWGRSQSHSPAVTTVL
jgi:hypothetical protein